MTERVRDVAISVATRAGHLLRKEGGKRHRVTFKGSPTDLVTEMDRCAETLIIESLLSAFPTHAILSEECGHVGPASSYRWIIDPLQRLRKRDFDTAAPSIPELAVIIHECAGSTSEQ